MLWATWKKESGNVESALTLIPLMILFLGVLQISISVYARLSGDQQNQGAIAYAAMGSASNSGTPYGPGITSPWVDPLIAVPLPGGGSLLVGTRKATLPAISPLLPNGDGFFTSGIAVQE